MKGTEVESRFGRKYQSDFRLNAGAIGPENLKGIVMMSRLVVGLAAVLTISAAASAQTLGDVARQEEARRKTVKAPAKVYTNDSLRPDPSSPRPAAASTPGSPASSAGSAAPSTPDAKSTGGTPAPAPDASAKDASAKDASAKDASAKDEASWKRRMAAAREAVERAKIFADALQDTHQFALQ